MKFAFALRSLQAKLGVLLLLSIALTLFVATLVLGYSVQRYHEEATEEAFAKVREAINQEMGVRITTMTRALAALAHEQRVVDLVEAFDLEGRIDLTDDVGLALKQRLARALAGLGAQLDGTIIAFDEQGAALAYFDNSEQRKSFGVLQTTPNEKWIATHSETILFGPGTQNNTQTSSGAWSDSLAASMNIPKGLAELELAWRVVDGKLNLVIWIPVLKGESAENIHQVGFLSLRIRDADHWLRPISLRERIDFGWLLPNAKSSDVLDVLPDENILFKAPTLASALSPGATQRDGQFETPLHLARAFRLPYGENDPIYLVLSAEKNQQRLKIATTISFVMLALLLSAAIVLPLGIRLSKRLISSPMEKLVDAIESVKRGKYEGLGLDAQVHDDLGHVLAAFHDMATTLKRREHESQLWVAVFEKTREAIFITDGHGNILYVNRAFTEITGFEESEVRGDLPGFLRAGFNDPLFHEGVWRTLREAGYWTGEAWDRRKGGSAYPQWVAITTIRNNEGHVTNYVGIFSDMTERKAQEERIQFLAHHDALTGLPNRVLLHDRLGMAMSKVDREGGLVGLLFIDLDRFKYINDTLGHTTGDALLNAVAERLKKAVRNSDTVSRLGGDEFMVILSKIRHAEDATHVAEHIIAMLAPTYQISENNLSISPSIGISIYPNDAKDIDTLIKNADVAMYQAKAKGRNTYQFFSPEMTAEAVEHLSLEHSLRQAVDRDEFVLYYQPQIDIATKKLTGVEALVRWRSPEHGLVPPTKFIPIAEESGLILQVGSWVLHEACRQRAEWSRQGVLDFPVAINVSALQFRQPDFQQRVVEIMHVYGVTGKDIEIELTESVVMEDAENTIKVLRNFRDLGVNLAIDDFGTGYSSMGYLKHLPIVKLKIDSSFVRDLETDPADRAIVEAIISLGRALDLTLVAEGVENRQILGILSKNGCHVAQGYHYCRPIPADDFVQWMQDFLNPADDPAFRRLQTVS